MTKTVLVIDDSELALEVIKDDLEDGGFTVLPVQSAQEGVELLGAGKRPDIILVDLIMPGIDGGAFCKMIKGRDDTKNIPVILVSMKEEKEIRPIITAVGADGFLWKANVSARALTKLIEKLQI